MIKPVRNDLQCYKGQTFIQPILFERSKHPWPLSGLAAKAQIRPSENSTKLIAEMTATVYDADGLIELYLNSGQTAAIEPGFYTWDLKTTNEHGDVIPWLYGQFIVTGRTTV